MSKTTKIVLVIWLITLVIGIATTVSAGKNAMSVNEIIKWHSDCASLATMGGYERKAAIHLTALEPYMDDHLMVINAYSSYAQGMVSGVALSVAGDRTHDEKIVFVAQSIYNAGCPTA